MTAPVEPSTNGAAVVAPEVVAQPAPRRLLTREEVFAIDDRKYEEVPVPEWGEGAVVRISSISAAQRLAFVAASQKAERSGNDDSSLLLLIFSIVDENGEVIFKVGDIPMLQKKSLRAITRISQRVNALNGLDRPSVEELRKN